MSFVAECYRRLWQRAMRAYHLACARDDVAAHGLAAPSGVWLCGWCPQVLLETTAMREHLRVEHSMPLRHPSGPPGPQKRI